MIVWLKIFKCILSYKAPEDTEVRIELLEDENQGGENENDKINWQKIIEKAINGDKDGKNKIPTVNKQTLTVKKRNKSKKHEINGSCSDISDADIQAIKNNMIASKLAVNIEFIKQRFSVPKNQDIVIREFNIAQKIEACIVFVDGMMDKTVINQFILPQLMNPEYFKNYNGEPLLNYIVKNVISVYQVTKINDFEKIIYQILNGVTALFIEGCKEALLIESRGFEKRNIEAPKTENVIKGSHEAFTENLRTNLSLLRKIIKNEKLISEILPVGNKNKVNCALVYLEDTADPALVKEVKRRIKNIDYDFVEGGGMLEQLLEDNPFMLLPQVVSTERPDRAASFIMEGQVVIICEGSPFVMAVPVTFFHLFHTSEDTTLRWQYGTFVRFIRFLGMIIALLLPGLWIALVLFHSEMIPTSLLLSIIKMREPVPFPVVIELLLMEVSFELIREGGIRVPGVIGQTLGIIGALILGQAAVAAGLVSPILIIVVAITGIGSFVIPNYSLAMAIRIGRFLFIIFGAVLGFYGISIGVTILIVIACSMKSFGVPFLTPLTPKTKPSDDLVVRKPIYNQPIREDYLNAISREKTANHQRTWKFESEGDNNS